jgi:hypothetical protein
MMRQTEGEREREVVEVTRSQGAPRGFTHDSPKTGHSWHSSGLLIDSTQTKLYGVGKVERS